MKNPIGYANTITLIRILLTFGVVALLPNLTFTTGIISFVLTVLIILLDGLDGIVARKFNETSKAGSVLDILGDRIAEQVYWIAFTAMGWVPLWVTLTIVVRGIVVDGIRSLAFEQGFTAFGDTTLMQSKLSTFLTSGRASRFAYGGFKILAFCLVVLAHTPGLAESYPPLSTIIWSGVLWLTEFSIYATLVICLLRGFPVLIDGARFLRITPADK